MLAIAYNRVQVMITRALLVYITSGSGVQQTGWVTSQHNSSVSNVYVMTVSNIKEVNMFSLRTMLQQHRRSMCIFCRLNVMN